MKNPIVVENEKRVKRMNELYELDQRDKPGPNQNTFTGLGVEIETYRKFAKELAIYEKWNDKNYPLS